MMNIICGLILPDQGSVTIFDEPVWNNADLRRHVGFCPQIDNFYENFSSLQFLTAILSLHGNGKKWAKRTASEALEIVGLSDSANKRVRAYSKGMRQRVKIALALAHQPDVLVLDEPFNGLDPVGRREMMQLFADYAREGRTIILSSHILHEIEQMTDRILMMSNGYVLAEGEVHQVRDLLRGHPFQVFIRCDRPRDLAGQLLAEDSVIGIELEDERSMTLTTRDPDSFFLRLNDVVLRHNIEIDVVTLADENVQSIYKYLSGNEHH